MTIPLLSELHHLEKRQWAHKLATGPTYLTLQQIGDMLGLTRERVRQYLVDVKRTPFTKHYGYSCARCGADFQYKTKSGLCPACRRKSHAPIILTCSQCGTRFPRRRSDVNAHQPGKWPYKTDNVFCNKRCQGLYAAQRYGFPAHPENAAGGRRLPSVREQVRWLAMKGYDADEIKKVLNLRRAGVLQHLGLLKRKENKEMAWIKIIPQGRIGADVYLQSGKGGVCSIAQRIWQGDLPEACDVYIDTDTGKIRIQPGSAYKVKLTRSRILLHLRKAQALLNVKTSGVSLPHEWVDGGLELDLRQWVETKTSGFTRLDKG